MKLPLPPPPGELQIHADDHRTLPAEAVLWRVHRTSGEHVVAWDRLRYWGPVATARFDPHEPPSRDQDRGVSYAALSVPTALAEVFQQTRVINPHRGAPYLTAWSPVRPLALLDITATWPIRAGASYAINSGRRDHCRAWARAIHAAQPGIDGLWCRSAMTGRETFALFTHAADTFPPRPAMSVPLNHPGLRPYLLAGADEIGYRVV